VYLATAREHPAAVVRHQQERDIAALAPTVRGLTERQHQLFFLLHTVIARHTPEGFTRLLDADVAEASAALAATLETEARGVIYEHVAQSRPAQRLASEMKDLIAEMRKQGAVVRDREMAVVLRAIEQGARNTPRSAGDETAYLKLMARLLGPRPDAEASAGASAGSALILP
jgi:hypothetical protein